MGKSFLVRVNGTGNNSGGRLFRITPGEGPDEQSVVIDCKDVRTRFESQSIIELADAGSPEDILADRLTRDAIASAWYNATSHESGHYPAGGVALPDGFGIEVVGP